MSRSLTAFTSGCFDDLHFGHRHLLNRMNELATTIIVGLNSDSYIRRYKHREPIYTAKDRIRHLMATDLVDNIVEFDDDGPLKLIQLFRPDFIVVGSDYTMDRVVGAQECLEWGGRVEIVPRLAGFSTSEILEAKAAIESLAADRNLAHEYLRGDRDEELLNQ